MYLGKEVLQVLCVKSNFCFFLFICARFISEEDVLNRLRSTFTGLYTLDEVRKVEKI